MIYQNIFCIKCHSIKQFRHSSIQTSCGEILDAEVNAETLLTLDCDINNVVPEFKESLVTKYQCFDYNLQDKFDSECNVPAELKHDIVTACNQSTWPYLENYHKTILVYRNVFCFVCQFGIEAVNEDTIIKGKDTILWPLSVLINN